MKSISLLLAVVIVLTIPITATAASPDDLVPYALYVRPALSFDGTTAKCSATVVFENTSDTGSIILRLWQGNSCIATWSKSGTGYLHISRSKAVTSGLQYKLTADVTINGISRPTVSIAGKCE